MKFALVTCLEKPEGTFDDQLLKAALVKEGHSADFRVWNGAVDWTQFDFCLIRSTWDYHRHLPKFLAWIQMTSRSAKVLNPLDVVKWSADKRYLCDLGERRVPVVPTKVYTSGEEAVRAIKNQIVTGRVVAKPTVSATAELTFRIDTDKELDKHVKAILERSPLALQPYVESIETDGELSLVYFMIDGKPTYSHSVVKRPKRGEFRVQEDFGGSVEKISPNDACLGVAKLALESIKMKWVYARVDLVDWNSQPRVGELELVEPELFFRLHKDSIEMMVRALT